VALLSHLAAIKLDILDLFTSAYVAMLLKYVSLKVCNPITTRNIKKHNFQIKEKSIAIPIMNPLSWFMTV